MKILTNREYNKLIDKIQDYENKIDTELHIKRIWIEKAHNLEVENYKLNNIIKSYKGVDYKNTNKMITKFNKIIMMKLDHFDTSADELDKLFKIYYSLKGTLEDE